jgi:hypothetical protein
MAHKVGDFVTIKRDIELYSGRYITATSSMLIFKGKQARITKTNGKIHTLCIDRGRFLWDDTMFEEV